jgi:hypothetical protein
MTTMVRTRIVVDIVTDGEIQSRDLDKIVTNAKGMVNLVATAEVSERVKPLMLDQINATYHVHNGADDMCTTCVRGLAQDGLK